MSDDGVINLDRSPYTGRHGGGGESCGGAEGMEARVAKLEVDVEYIKRDVGELRTDVRDVRERLIKVEAAVSHLPSKAFVFGVYGVIGALIVAVTLFQSQIQSVIGLVTKQ